MSIIPVALATAAVVVIAPTNVRFALSMLDQPHAGARAPANIIVQKYSGEDPHGADPHGDDPHDEVHDDNMKANEDQKASRAPKDVYGGDYNNTQAPY